MLLRFARNDSEEGRVKSEEGKKGNGNSETTRILKLRNPAKYRA
jgi:hypothetical protein